MYIERDSSARLNFLDGLYDMVAVVGPRQSGKTTLLKRSLAGDNPFYVLLDDIEAKGLFEESPKTFEQRYLEGRDITVLDEVQHCANAGQTLKYFVDSGRRMWITSSSEVLLGAEVLSYLVGRVGIMRLYPFSLPEFLRAKNEKVLDSRILERLVLEHMTYGGYPKVVLTANPEGKKALLRDLYETMLLKDISQTFSITKLGPLKAISVILASQPGSLVAYDKLADAIRVSFRTVKKYLSAMERSYLISSVRPYFKNRAKEISKQPRAYFIDTGLRNAVVEAFDDVPDGRLFENYVHSELIKMGHQVRHWRTKSGAEVDFALRIGKETIPVEAKLSAKPNKVETGLRAFIDTYAPKRAFVVCYKGKRGESTVNGCDVRYVDALALWDAIGKEGVLHSSEKSL